MKKLIIALLLTFALMMPMVSAVTGNLGTFKMGECVQLLQTCADCTYNTITSVTFPDSTQALGLTSMEKNGLVYNYTFCDTNYTGVYTINGFGDLGGTDTIWNYQMEITNTGKGSTTGSSFLLGILLILFAGMFIFAAARIGNSESYAINAGYVSLSYFLLLIFIFLLDNLTNDYLEGVPVISQILGVVLTMMIIGLLPLFLGLAIYVLYKQTEEKQVKKLMGMGYTSSEARNQR